MATASIISNFAYTSAHATYHYLGADKVVNKSVAIASAALTKAVKTTSMPTVDFSPIKALLPKLPSLDFSQLAKVDWAKVGTDCIHNARPFAEGFAKNFGLQVGATLSFGYAARAADRCIASVSTSYANRFSYTRSLFSRMLVVGFAAGVASAFPASSPLSASDVVMLGVNSAVIDTGYSIASSLFQSICGGCQSQKRSTSGNETT